MTTCSIIITDTGPLKTLAYAGSLHLLLAPGLTVFVTDMVLVELENGKIHSGNRDALAFIALELGRPNGQLRKIETGVPANVASYKALRVNPGEQSIKIALEDYAAANPDDFALLLFEDADIAKSTFVLPANVSLLTTRPFLLRLEKMGIVESAEALLRTAEMASLAADDARFLVNREQEHDVPPRGDQSVKPF